MAEGQEGPLVVDASAAVSYLDGAPAEREGTVRALESAIGRQRGILIHSVNAGETYYVLARKHGEREAERALTVFEELGVRIVDGDWLLAKKAARLKARHGLPYADSFAAALVLEKEGRLLTRDHDFEAVDKLIPIIWADK